jgi:cytochrome P450
VNVDLFDEKLVAEPYAAYRAIRDAGPLVWLPRSGVWAMGRYADVKSALADHASFSSAGGPGLNMPANNGMRGTIVASDEPAHDGLRLALGGPLGAGALREVRELIQTAADEMVADLVKRSSFDAVSDLSQVLPLTIVRELVGLPEEGRDNMLAWGAAAFDALGPDSARTSAAIAVVGSEIAFATDPGLPARMKPGGWGARIFEAAERGVIRREQCAALVLDLINPSLDTTVNATSALLLLLARHPDQYERLRADPSLIPHAINEAIRLESPIRGFTRLSSCDQEVDGAQLPKGARVLVLYASANRDERKWPDPERFDIARKPSDHLAFGYGIHSCVGMHLARLEITAIFESILKRVRRIEVAAAKPKINNLLRGWTRIVTRFEAA